MENSHLIAFPSVHLWGLNRIKYYDTWDHVVCSHWCLECMSGHKMGMHHGNVMEV